ncbi:MAG: CRTAC1 family protein, partial [Sphingobacteriia bacterium]
QVNDGTGRFLETGFFSGVAASDWSWGALVFDADNDSRSDIFVCNGIYRDVTDQDFIDFFANDVVKQMVVTGKKEDVNNVINKMPSVPIPNQAFRNQGGLQFSNASVDWGLDQPSFSNGAVYADLDNDGDLDLVINNVNQPAAIYRNQSREKKSDSSHYLAIEVAGSASNKRAIGTTLKLFCGAATLTREIIPSRGFQSSMEYKQTIGLGNLRVDSMQVIFPDNSFTTLLQPGQDTLLQLSYDKLEKRSWQPHQYPGNGQGNTGLAPLFQAKNNEIFAPHVEDEWVDFYYERNLPFMLSKQGPAMAKADVNGDGREDVFLGGAKGQASQLYLQTPTGWALQPTPGFAQFKFNDVTAAAFLDMDRDGDPDLVLGGGGNMDPASADSYQHLFYRNQGKGNFVLEPGFFPIAHTNAGFILPLDYDGDGWTDLLFGSRSLPQQYGQAPPSFLFRNQAGKPQDVTAAVAPFLQNLGMLTAGDWKDLNQDGKPELILTGEWMAPQVFVLKGKAFQAMATGLEKEKGWWQSLLVIDVDKDGDQDLVLGNLGQNFYLQAAKDRPVKVWLKDVDQNGTVEKIFSHTLKGKDVPVFLKKDLTEQLPALKKSNLKHVDYANKTLQDVFGKDLTGAQVLTVEQTASVVALNNGKGGFLVQSLPLTVQLSSVQAMVAQDLDQDGLPEIIGAGNFTDLLPQFCRIDAGYGFVLQNKGKGKFEALPAAQTGLSIPGQVRAVLALPSPLGMGILFGVNHQRPQLYQLQKMRK